MTDVAATPTPERPVVRLRLLPVLAATTLAVAAYVAGSYLPVLPDRGFAVVLLAVAPTAAVAATALLALRARSELDDALRWVAAGLAVASVGMVLQLVAHPLVSAGGGVLGTTVPGTFLLYFHFHLALLVGVGAAALRWPPRWVTPFLLAGTLLALLAALPSITPSRPVWVRSDGGYTTATVVVESGIVALTVAAGVLWLRAIGRRPSATRGWLLVALMLSAYDVLLNAVGHRRYSPIWWSSLGLRALTYAVLLGGLIWAVARQLAQTETYVDQERQLAAGGVETLSDANRRLLAVSAMFADALTPADVATVLGVAGTGITGWLDASVYMVDADDGSRLRRVNETSGVQHGGNRGVSLDQPSTLADAVLHKRIAVAGQPRSRDPEATVTELAVPLMSAGVAVGALALAGDARRFTTLETQLLTALGTQGAQALQRSVLFERQQSAARVLQQSLLPQRLPMRVDLELVARYLPATSGVDVGGDWYDVVEVDDDRALLVIGDVMGKGVAAATLMGHMRSAIRTLAAQDPNPESILTGLDRLARDFDPDLLVTVALLLLDRSSSSVRVGNAGHLPPVLLLAEGGAEQLRDCAGPPIGAPWSGRRTSVDIAMPVRATILLVTDGLVEDRRVPVDTALLDICSRAQQLLHTAGGDLDTVADSLVNARLRREDDLTLLLARPAWQPAGPNGTSPLRLVLLRDAAAAPRARRELRQRLAALRPQVPSDVIDAVELVTSELVTNSLRHGRGTITVSWHQPRLDVGRLSVHDYDETVPTPRTADDDDTDGRGLTLIEALAERWGVDREAGGGKTTWVEFQLGAREIVLPDVGSTDTPEHPVR